MHDSRVHRSHELVEVGSGPERHEGRGINNGETRVNSTGSAPGPLAPGLRQLAAALQQKQKG